MKYLSTDRQTMADLGIETGLYGEEALSSLFLPTETQKGKLLLLFWLGNPLSDKKAIEERQQAVAWDGLPELPLDAEELDLLEYYLDYREQLPSKGAFLSLVNKVGRFLKSDPSRYIITRGVGLVLRMFGRLDQIQHGQLDSPPAFMKEWLDKIRDVLGIVELKEALTLDMEESFSDYVIDRYDYIFRQEHLTVIKELLDYIYQLDVYRTLHRAAGKYGFCCTPTMTDAMELSVFGFLHPLLRKGQRNDWSMSNHRLSIFTGTNMAGKSTTLKALASIVWLAHCGFPVPVASMVCPVYEGIYTSVNLPDSLRDGRSHFMAEVLRIKEVLQQARSGMRCLVVLDEMFRGTNAQDAFEASVSVSKLLGKYVSCHFLVSTHILEYAKAFETDASCCFYYMESEIKGDDFVCSHCLKQGISESRVGYWLVKKELYAE